jgi:hypothetical protein
MSRSITIRLEDEVYDAVREEAEDDHRSMNSMVTLLLIDALHRRTAEARSKARHPSRSQRKQT